MIRISTKNFHNLSLTHLPFQLKKDKFEKESLNTNRYESSNQHRQKH